MAKYPDRCPENIDFDVYQDCKFGCVYCISKSRPKANTLPRKTYDPLAQISTLFNEKNVDIPVYLCPWTDPYPAREKDLQYTKKILSLLKSLTRAYFVVTKGLLVQRDIPYQYPP